jgi:sterol desaturase/sphingolipid hydroxylase (fatty acid hydroxylase superfamily)
MFRLLFGLLVLSVLYGTLERLWPSVPVHRRWRHSKLDLLYFFLRPALGVISQIPVVIMLLPIALLLGRELGPETFRGYGPMGGLPPVQQAFAMVIGADFLGYWAHRIFHGPFAVLWRIHAVHHSSEHLDWLSALRSHPLNKAITRLPQTLLLLGVGFDPLVLAGVQPLLGLYAVGLHANVRWRLGPIEYLVATPAFHRWHHSAEEEGLNKNFAGLFPIWDIAFGTFHLPARPSTRFGLVGHSVPPGFVGQMLHPLRFWHREPVQRSRTPS